MGTIVSKTIPALYNGVSQQAAPLRLPSQAQAQINCTSSVSRGVGKRRGARWVAEISDQTEWDHATTGEAYQDSLSEAKYHYFTVPSLPPSERGYIAAVLDGDLKVWRKNDGAEMTVNFPVGTSYLDLPADTADDTYEPRWEFELVSVGSYTFVVNKTVEVDTAVPPTSQPAAWSDWFFPDAWGSSFAAEDYYNHTTANFQKEIQSFEDLPEPPLTVGHMWEIAGTDKDAFSTYYVEANSTDSVKERWDHGAGGSLGLDETTMPMALVYDSGTGEFILTYFPWKVRKVGDDNTNPPPSFAGQKINDVFFYKNRLGFVAGENVIMSCAGDFGNFWRTTVTDLLDTDMIDIAVSGTEISELRYAVPFNNTMMLFADKGQFAMNVEEILSPSTVSVDNVTNYTMDKQVKPVGLGSEVYFTENRGKWSTVREYFVSDETNSTEAADITAHVPEYVHGRPLALVGSSNHGALFVISAYQWASNLITVYQFLWGPNGKAQSAWSNWSLGEGGAAILYAEMVDDHLVLVISRTDGIAIEQIAMTHDDNGYVDREILLDRLSLIWKDDADVANRITWDGANTHMILPYRVEDGEEDLYRLVKASNDNDDGLQINPELITWEDTTGDGYWDRIELDASLGDLTGSSERYYIGQSYPWAFQLSEQFVRNGDDAVLTGDLLMNKVAIRYKDTALLTYEVLPHSWDDALSRVYGNFIPAREENYDAFDLDESYFYTNKPTSHEGTLELDLMGDSNKVYWVLYNNTPYQSFIQSMEWEGFFTKNSRSI